MGSTLTDITINSLIKTKYKKKSIFYGYKYLILGKNKVVKKKKKNIYLIWWI